MKKKLIAITTLIIAIPLGVQADAVSDLQENYRAKGATPFTASAGETFWNQSFTDAKSGKKRNCTTCHGTDLTQRGKHARTGKVIKPMAVSANPKRLTEVKKIKKWFVRNCKWTLGRECSVQEKGDILAYLKQL